MKTNAKATHDNMTYNRNVTYKLGQSNANKCVSKMHIRQTGGCTAVNYVEHPCPLFYRKATSVSLIVCLYLTIESRCV